MSITLAGIELPDDLIWRNELNWSKIHQKRTITLTGALIIEESARIKGRAIELYGTQNFGWITRSTLLQLKTQSDLVDNTMVLDYNGTAYNVKFMRDNDQSPVQSTQIRECSNPSVDEFYQVELRLITV